MFVQLCIVYLSVYVHAGICVCAGVYLHVYMHEGVYVCAYKYVCIVACVYVCMCVYACVYVCLRCGRQEREGNFQTGFPPKLEGQAVQGMVGSGLKAGAPIHVTFSFHVNKGTGDCSS